MFCFVSLFSSISPQGPWPLGSSLGQSCAHLGTASLGCLGRYPGLPPREPSGAPCHRLPAPQERQGIQLGQRLRPNPVVVCRLVPMKPQKGHACAGLFLERELCSTHLSGFVGPGRSRGRVGLGDSHPVPTPCQAGWRAACSPSPGSVWGQAGQPPSKKGGWGAEAAQGVRGLSRASLSNVKAIKATSSVRSRRASGGGELPQRISAQHLETPPTPPPAPSAAARPRRTLSSGGRAPSPQGVPGSLGPHRCSPETPRT